MDGVPRLVQAGRAQVIGEDERIKITFRATEDHEGVVAPIADRDREVRSTGLRTVDTGAIRFDAGGACAAGSYQRIVGVDGDVDALAEAEVVDELDAVEVDVDRRPNTIKLTIDDTDGAAADNGRSRSDEQYGDEGQHHCDCCA